MKTKALILSAGTFAALVIFRASQAHAAFAGGVFVDATCDIIWYMSGSLGAMLTAATVLTLIAGAALGNLKGISAVMAVMIGSYTMYDWVVPFFGDLGCASGGGTSRVENVLDAPAKAASTWQIPSADDE